MKILRTYVTAHSEKMLFCYCSTQHPLNDWIIFNRMKHSFLLSFFCSQNFPPHFKIWTHLPALNAMTIGVSCLVGGLTGNSRDNKNSNTPHFSQADKQKITSGLNQLRKDFFLSTQIFLCPMAYWRYLLAIAQTYNTPS